MPKAAKETITFRLDKAYLQQLDALAEEDGTSRNLIARRLVLNALNDADSTDVAKELRLLRNILEKSRKDDRDGLKMILRKLYKGQVTKSGVEITDEKIDALVDQELSTL